MFAINGLSQSEVREDNGQAVEQDFARRNPQSA
jgi:hypothetical protein